VKLIFQFQLQFALIHVRHGLDLLTVDDDLSKLDWNANAV
jgi:hypothetical protein